MFLTLAAAMLTLVVYGIIAFEILDDASRKKLTKIQTVFFLLVFSFFEVVAILVLFS